MGLGELSLKLRYLYRSLGLESLYPRTTSLQLSLEVRDKNHSSPIIMKNMVFLFD